MTWALLTHAGNEKWNNAACAINWKMHIVLLPHRKMTVQAYSWHTPGLHIGKGAENMAISCPDGLISSYFRALGPARVAAPLPEKHPTLVAILGTHSLHCPVLVVSEVIRTPHNHHAFSSKLLVIHHISQTICTWIFCGDTPTLLAFNKIHASLDRHL